MKMQNPFSMTALALTTALVVPSLAQAQTTFVYTDWDNDGNLELTDTEFAEGFAETGTYDAWDRDETAGLSEGEFATGVFSRWDMDNDLQITEEEYEVGSERWYGADYDTPFAEYDLDDSGYIDTTEFGESWDSDYYADWDADADGLLTEEEYTTGIYETADVNDDYVITVEEEGWFEGWFDGDDVEAEIQEVGDVL